MTAFDYDRAEATAQRLITKFGQSGTIRRVTNGGTPYDPTQVETDFACTLVVIDYENSMIDGTRIQAGDKRVFVSTEGLTIEPTTADKVLVSSTEHSIINVMPLNPGGTVVFHELQTRT